MIKYYRILLLISAFSFLLLFFSAAPDTDEQKKQITVVLRFDDISAISCTEIEEKLIADLRKLNMCCTFGVIPFACVGDGHDPAPQELIPLPMAKIELLRQASEDGVIEIAQHGYSHQTNDLRADKSHNYSEFVGFSYEKQLERIKQGKEFLEQKLKIPVTTFIPPLK